MSAQLPNESVGDASVQTLGQLLYADPTKPTVSELEWVALVRACGSGDQAALQSIYDRSHRLVFTLTMRITGSRQMAEELTLDVFHDVWRRASTYDVGSGTVLGWIMNQARSRAIDRLRYEGRKKRASVHRDEALEAALTEDAVEETIGRDERRRVLQLALAALSQQEREVIETAFFAELSYAQVAERLEQPLGTVKTRIRSGLEKLRRALMERAP